jgi:hypothetical protein
MRPGCSVAACTLLITLAVSGCGGEDAVTAPLGSVEFSSGKPRAYEAELLPLLPGATRSEAIGLNDKGQIVGDAGDRAVRWDPGASVPVPLEVISGQEWSAAIGISEGGDIVGAYQPPQEDSPVDIRVVRWPAGGGVGDLGAMCCESIGAAAINKQGDIAWVGDITGGGPFGLHLLRHGTRTTVEVPSEALLTGLHVTTNSHNDVAFGAFIWSRQIGWRSLSSAYNGGGLVLIWGMNDRTDIAAADGDRGTLYPHKGDVVPFGLDLVPQSINNPGVIVGPTGGFGGWSGFSMANSTAKIRFADGTMAELPKPSGFAPGTEVSLSPARINDDGLIVGYSDGIIGGQIVARRATVWRPLARR